MTGSDCSPSSPGVRASAVSRHFPLRHRAGWPAAGGPPRGGPWRCAVSHDRPAAPHRDDRGRRLGHLSRVCDSRAWRFRVLRRRSADGLRVPAVPAVRLGGWGLTRHQADAIGGGGERRSCAVGRRLTRRSLVPPTTRCRARSRPAPRRRRRPARDGATRCASANPPLSISVIRSPLTTVNPLRSSSSHPEPMIPRTISAMATLKPTSRN